MLRGKFNEMQSFVFYARRRFVFSLLLLGVHWGTATMTLAQFNLTTTNYTQDFNSLGTNPSSGWTNNTTLPGWFALAPLTNAVVISNVTGATLVGGLGNFSSVINATDRSLGWVLGTGPNAVSSLSNYVSIGFGLSNSTGLNLGSFSLSYTGREWRGYSNNTPALSFQYKIGGAFDNDPTNSLTGAWTDFSPLNFQLPVTNANSPVDGLSAPNFTGISNTVSGLSWLTSEVLWLRWRQENLPLADAQMAIDDLVFNAFEAVISHGNYWSAVPGGGGSGIWTSGGTNWATNSGGAGAGQGQSGETLVFADTAGTVTVSGGVVVSNGMTFQTTGYDLQGSGTITLAGATAGSNSIGTATGVTTTISSELAGTTGLTKTGGGTLVLSGPNSFSGNVTISAGTLQITDDSALGNAANDLFNNGTLKTTASVSLEVGRDISGGGTYDIANGTTLTVNGNVNNTATTLANTGTLDLQGGTRSLGLVTINAAITLNAVASISASGLTAPGVSSGTATINPDIVFTANDKTLNVAAGGTVDLHGALSNGGDAGRLVKTGGGTLILGGANTMGGLRVGVTAASPTDGGTVVLQNATIGTQAQAIQLNYGTVRAASNLEFTNGISIAGRTNGAAVLAGGNMDFQGQSVFFRGIGTSGELILKVNNTTTFSGGIGATTNGGSATGITIGGNGHMIISGDASAMVDTITLTDTIKLTLSNTIGGSLNVGGASVLAGGGGTVSGNLSFSTGAKLELNLLNPTLTVNGSTVSFVNWTINNIVGLDSSTPDGKYALIGGTATVSTNGLANIGLENAFDLGDGKSAYFSIGSLELNVVPEPSTYALLVLSAAGLGADVVRRRRRHR